MRQARHLSFASAAICAAALAVGTAHADTVTFENDGSGPRANGMVSLDSPSVTFSATYGSGLYLGQFSPEGIGNSLAVLSDDSNRLDMAFSTPMDSLSLDFGNDDDSVAVAGDRAWLLLFSGGIQVAAAFVALNLDDIMNQTISYSGVAFDSAQFFFGNALGTPIDLIEVVDNISFTPIAVAEPASLALLGAGLLGLGLVQQRRRPTGAAA